MENKGLNEFLKILTTLSPEEFLGVARLLGVELAEKKDD